VDATLLNTQKRDVFEMLANSGLEPHQFEWTSRKTHGSIGGPPPTHISILQSKSRPEFHFTFDFAPDSYYPVCSPWKGARVASLGEMSWPYCLTQVQVWARRVQDELSTPDPWKALPGLATTSDIAVARDVANTEFSHRETDRLANGLEQIRQLLIDAAGRSEQTVAVINTQLNSLLDASKRMGRKDWVNQAIGALMTLSITLALPAETTKQALEILRQTLSGLVHLTPHIIAGAQQLT
jgi:hypothetical protein